MATSTSGESPGVEMAWSEMWTWKAETPAKVPAGARISAGKSGKVARSLPSRADVVVKRSPANCMPSPESPANRMTTRSSRWGALVSVVVSDTVLLFVPLVCRRDTARRMADTCLRRRRSPGPATIGLGRRANRVYPPVPGIESPGGGACSIWQRAQPPSRSVVAVAGGRAPTSCRLLFQR